MNIQPILHNSIPVRKINFNGLPQPAARPVSIDSFQKSTGYIKLEKLYNRLFKMTSQVTPEDIGNIIKKFKQYPKEQVLLVMNKLTGFANPDKIFDFKIWLESNKIDYIENFQSLYSTKKRVYKINQSPVENKKTDTQEEIVKYVIPQNKLLNLNQVFSYFYNSGFGSIGKCPLGGSIYGAVILDARTVNYLQEIKDNNPAFFDTLKNRYKYIYIKDFEGSYNIFEQHKDFEKILSEKLILLDTLKKNNPAKADNDILNLIMNGRNLKNIKNLGLEPIIADLNFNEAPSAVDIASNLSNTFPAKENFIETIQNCLKKKHFSDSEKEELVEYLDKYFYTCSFKTISEKLIKLRQQIEDNVKKHGKDINKIYYSVAKPGKSFVLINYMYQKANDISPNRFIYWENTRQNSGKEAYTAIEKMLPKGATLVILDDAFISGESILQSQFNYRPWRNKDSFDIIFASVYSSSKASQRLESYIEKTNNDRIISVDYQELEDLPANSPITEPSRNTLILFPYNSPDNNCAIFQDLYRLFYPSYSFIQSPWIHD